MHVLITKNEKRHQHKPAHNSCGCCSRFSSSPHHPGHRVDHKRVALGNGLALCHTRCNGSHICLQVPRRLLGQVEQQVKVFQALVIWLGLGAFQMCLELALTCVFVPMLCVEMMLRLRVVMLRCNFSIPCRQVITQNIAPLPHPYQHLVATIGFQLEMWSPGAHHGLEF